MQTQPKDEIYIVFQPTDDGQWVPQSECSQIPIEQLMGISGGVALAILIVVITTAYLIVFYRDRKRWLKFEAEKKENERRFGENVNPLFGKNLDNIKQDQKSLDNIKQDRKSLDNIKQD